MTASTFFASSEVKETKNENKENKELGLIRLYLDFDGTLSGRKGSECVFSKLYGTLQKNANDDYGDAAFIEEKEMVSKLVEGFKEDQNKTMQLAAGSFKFLNDMLDLGAELNIVSRNRKEYIRANLLAAGMSVEKVNKITIYDVNCGAKYGVVCRVEKSAKDRAAKVTVVCDDDSSDYNAMTSAVKASNADTALVACTAKPGQFNWTEVAKEVLEKAALTVAAPSVKLA